MGKQLKSIHFDYIISSDLGRARKTADIILETNNFKNSTQIFETELAREFDYGIYSGKSSSIFYQKMAEFKRLTGQEGAGPYEADLTDMEIEDGESFGDFLNRVEGLIRKITDFSLRNKDFEGVLASDIVRNHNRVLLVAHAGVVMNIKRFILREKKSDEVVKSVSNCSLSIFRAKANDDGKDQFKILMYDNIKEIEV